jgi:hypothetical protein
VFASLLIAGSIGVGTQGTPMCTPAMQPGTSAPAGQLYVTDTGTGAETVTVGTFPAGGQGQALRRGQMPASWVHVSYPRRLWLFTGSSLSLDPGGSAYLAVTVTVPTGTPRGMYIVNLWAHTAASPSPGHGVALSAGAGAATLLYAGVGETPSCTIPAPVKQAGSPDQYVAAGAAPQQQPSKGLSSGGAEILVVLAAIIGGYCLITRKRR